MEWERELEIIAKDNIHGATYLTKALVDLAAKVEDKERFLHKAQTIHPYMASIYNFLHDFALTSEPKEQFCKEWWKAFTKEHERVVAEGAKLIAGKKILVHSFSSVVYEAIVRSQGVRVIATESRPKNEGVELAKRLHKKGVEVELVIDGAAPFMVQEVDIVLFGADGIGEFGVVHKVGSLPIALAAKFYDKPVVVLAHSKKFWPHGFVLPPQPLQDPQEVCGCDVKVRNFYFDITPLKIVNRLLY